MERGCDNIEGKIMKQIATIFSKQLLTATTNHWTNCIWIKGSRFENNMKIESRKKQAPFSSVCMNKYFIVFFTSHLPHHIKNEFSIITIPIV